MNTVSIKQDAFEPSSEISRTVITADENPCLENVPATPTAKRAMDAMVRLGKTIKNGINVAPCIADLEHILIPTLEHAQVLMAVTAQIRESYCARDLRDPEYRRYTLSTQELLHKSFDRHGHRLPAKGGKAPGAKSRGIFVCAAARMGRHQTAEAVESFIGGGVRSIRVPMSGHFMDFLQLKTLRVNWPEKGKMRRFAKAFIAAFDSKMGTAYSLRTRGPLFREEDILPALCSLGTASNLGVLIVERINSRAATSPDALEMWDALGVFTRTTGIPVLCLATPGAAVGLAEQSGSIGDLVSTGLHRLYVPSAHSPAWQAVCKLYFKSSLALAGVKKIPDWFADCLWELSLGHYGVAVNACTVVARYLISTGTSEISKTKFMELAQKSLLLETRHLHAVKIASGGGTFKTFSLLRHGDWLPLENMLETMPSLALEVPPISVSGG